MNDAHIGCQYPRLGEGGARGLTILWQVKTWEWSNEEKGEAATAFDRYVDGKATIGPGILALFVTVGLTNLNSILFCDVQGTKRGLHANF